MLCQDVGGADVDDEGLEDEGSSAAVKGAMPQGHEEVKGDLDETWLKPMCMRSSGRPWTRGGLRPVLYLHGGSSIILDHGSM